MFHKHHILPVHAGGTNDSNNIILLTTQEHAEAHKKLYEDCGRWQDKLAWLGLSGRIGKEKIIRERASLLMTHRLKFGDLRGMWVGRKRTTQAKEKTSKTLRGRKFSNSHKEKISDSLKGKPKSQKHRMNLSKKSKGLDRASKIYIITFPDGRKETIRNLTKFSITLGFPKTSLFNVVTGAVKSYRGFKVRKVEKVENYDNCDRSSGRQD
jgi:hypothetical protein